MIAIVCIDSGRGMTFFGKRQSADRVISDRIISYAGGRRIVANAYTAARFRGKDANITVSDDPLNEAKEGDLCFIEDFDLPACSDGIEELILFRWNKKYPSDSYLSFYPYEAGMILSEIFDFKGFSHGRITEEIWTKR